MVTSSPFDYPTTCLAIGLFAFAGSALAEWLHGRRLTRVVHLAFGASGQAAKWTRAAGLLCAVACGAIAWGLMALLPFDSAPPEPDGSTDPQRIQHLVIALDVSPSMHLQDAGPTGRETRGDRARSAIRSILARFDLQQSRISVIAFYSTARPVVIDTFDAEVVANVLADLPLEHAFTAGKTDLYSCVRAAAEVAKSWREQSATLLIASDGDTLPPQDIPTIPKAYANVALLGVGSAQRGLFIDGHSSRQDVRSLERLALQLHGRYYDVNTKHLPSDVIRTLTPRLAPDVDSGIDRKTSALAAVAIGALWLASLPGLLALFGTKYRPVRLQRPRVAISTKSLPPAQGIQKLATRTGAPVGSTKQAAQT